MTSRDSMPPTDMSAFIELWGSSACVSPVSSSANLICDFSLLDSHEAELAFLHDWETSEKTPSRAEHQELADDISASRDEDYATSCPSDYIGEDRRGRLIVRNGCATLPRLGSRTRDTRRGRTECNGSKSMSLCRSRECRRSLCIEMFIESIND
ncbi:hypothetical protein GUITHDRAFT_154517 [Guillardia theta CCMP2712]|uniref:Uncharacterized protein n=1 Tax=Guillardia theta (strain CCMP2712) TaxID=905079 RepID=L1IT94_GUITC|nr:hypothetical protein GUITHDRAFT_154517 [Guillardia theta CCMP2712]EKX39119.1 hypothetical protein GUITHDRAFT_154517 [Guillardia theta CCMP2712]|eukprot:XP_005826099.1 hypothetical protein GUITHDRAFT_154517 [Guillardia theta CCMP2712]